MVARRPKIFHELLQYLGRDPVILTIELQLGHLLPYPLQEVVSLAAI